VAQFKALIIKVIVFLIKTPLLAIAMIIRGSFSNICEAKTGFIGTASWIVMSLFTAGFFYLCAQVGAPFAFVIFSITCWFIWDYDDARALIA